MSDKSCMDNIQKEKKTIAAMIEIYCKGNHKCDGSLCADCRQLLEYAKKRLDNCPFGNGKGACSKCTIHCYKPRMRQKIKAVMRYSGRRMTLKHPVLAVKHLWKEKFTLPKRD